MRTDLLLEHLDTMVRTPEDAAKLEAAILDLAMRGQLVPQDPSDEPATELLRRVEAEKSRLAKAGRVGRTEAVAPMELEPAHAPYGVPKGWVWCQLVELFYSVSTRGKQII